MAARCKYTRVVQPDARQANVPVKSVHWRVDAAGGHAYWMPHIVSKMVEALEEMLVHYGFGVTYVHTANLYVQKITCQHHGFDTRIFLLIETTEPITKSDMVWALQRNIGGYNSERPNDELNGIQYSPLTPAAYVRDVTDNESYVYGRYEALAPVGEQA